MVPIGRTATMSATPTPRTLRVAERTEDDGSLTPIALTAIDGRVTLRVGAEQLDLPEGAVGAAIARLGAPLDRAALIREVARLELPSGDRVRHVRHLDRFDVIARDYLVIEADGAPALAALALPVVRALEHVARAWSASRGGTAPQR